jgi:hypothetical protein
MFTVVIFSGLVLGDFLDVHAAGGGGRSSAMRLFSRFSVRLR